jgi:phenylacetaldehyde dehydrogenase
MNAPFSPATLEKLRADLAAKPRELFIGGKFVAAASGETFEVIDPATGQVFAHAASGDRADVDLAVQAARRALEGAWAKTTPSQRARMLLRLADLIEQNGEEIALLESLDNGMPIMMAKFGGVMGAAEAIRYNAGWATKITGETIDPSWPGEYHSFTLREPVGVVGSIVPWNFPFVMAAAKIAPALAAGCTVVLKPAEQTPLSAVKLAELVAEAGFPEGTVNVVTGFGKTAGAAIVDHPGVDKIAFTGSTVTGRAILHAAAADFKRVTLELGGKSPVVIFPDADLAKAIPSAAMGIFGNAGQVCAAGSRLFVHESVYDEVLEGVSKRAASLKVGAGLAPGTEMGPLVSQQQLSRVLGYIESGMNEGATVGVGGARIDGEGYGGYFVQPTVLTGTASGMKVVEEEIFGPVLCAMKFGDDDIDRIATQANASEYGLAASIWTRDMSNGLRLAKRIKAGTVRINGGGAGVDPAIPLGGYKQSGWGRDQGGDGGALIENR